MNEPGRILAERFRIVRRLARGGMGELWLAEHLGLPGAEVVVKLIAPELVGSTGAAARFAAEAAAVARVNSPYVVKMIDYGVTPEGTPFLVMEKLEGRDLAAYLASRGRLAPELVVRVVTQIAEGLERVHASGIVHRDVKPANVFVCDARGEILVKLLDFGVAKGGAAPTGATSGRCLGTPAYMSPEQVVGSSNVDARSDVWALGIVAFECLVGQRPFEGETPGAVALAIHTRSTPRPTDRRSDLPAEVDAWFGRACARDPALRFASAIELAEELAIALGATSAPTFHEANRGATAAPVVPRTATLPAESGGGFTRSEAPRPAGARPLLVRASLLGASIAIAAFVSTGATRLARRAPRTTVPEPAAYASQPWEPRPSVALLSAAPLDPVSEGPPPARSTTARPALPAAVAVVTSKPVPLPPPPLEPPSAPPPERERAPSLFVMPDARH